VTFEANVGALHDNLLSALGNAIVSGEYPPGEVLTLDGVSGSLGFWNALRCFGHDRIAIAEFDFESENFSRRLEILQEAVDGERRMRAKNVFGLSEDIFDVRAGNDTQSNFAVDAAESNGRLGAVASQRIKTLTRASGKQDSERVFHRCTVRGVPVCERGSETMRTDREPWSTAEY